MIQEYDEINTSIEIPKVDINRKVNEETITGKINLIL